MVSITEDFFLRVHGWASGGAVPPRKTRPTFLHGDSSVQSLSCVWLFATPWTNTRFPCPSPTPRAYSNSCPLSWWCHPTISSSFVPFSSCLQSFPASGSFQMSQFLASGGQCIGASTSASIFPMSIQDWFPLGCTGWISLQSKAQFKSINSSVLSFLCSPTLTSIPDYWKNYNFD